MKITTYPLFLWLLFISSGLKAADQAIEKTWGDWSKICTSGENSICQIVQSANQNESGQLIFQTAVGYADDNDKPILYLTGPLGIFLPRGIGITIDDAPIRAAVVQRCDNKGCLAVLPMEQDLIKEMEKGKTAKVIFATSMTQNVSLPLSLKGFKRAFRALK
jgi:invasion protein IalB